MAERKASEVRSDHIVSKLEEIEERLGSIEAAQAFVNRNEMFKWLKEKIDTPRKKELVRLCETPRSADELIRAMKLNNRQALDAHLRPLREHNVLHTKHDGVLRFSWCHALRQLTPADRKKLFE